METIVFRGQPFRPRGGNQDAGARNYAGVRPHGQSGPHAFKLISHILRKTVATGVHPEMAIYGWTLTENRRPNLTAGHN